MSNLITLLVIVFTTANCIKISPPECRTTRPDLAILKVEVYGAQNSLENICVGVAIRRMFLVVPKVCLVTITNRGIPKSVKALTTAAINEEYMITDICCRHRLCLLKTNRPMSSIIKPMCIKENDGLTNYMLMHHRSIILNVKFDHFGSFSYTQVDLFPTPVFDYPKCVEMSQGTNFPFNYFKKCLCLIDPYSPSEETSSYNCTRYTLGSPYISFNEDGIPNLLALIAHLGNEQTCCAIPVYTSVDWISRVIRMKAGECDPQGNLHASDGHYLKERNNTDGLITSWNETSDYVGLKAMETNHLIINHIQKTSDNSESCALSEEGQLFENFDFYYHNRLVTYFAPRSGNLTKDEKAEHVTEGICRAVALSNFHYLIMKDCFMKHVDSKKEKDIYMPSIQLNIYDPYHDLASYVQLGIFIQNILIVQLFQPMVHVIFSAFKRSVCFHEEAPVEFETHCTIFSAGKTQNITLRRQFITPLVTPFKFCLPEDEYIPLYCQHDSKLYFYGFGTFSGEHLNDNCYEHKEGFTVNIITLEDGTMESLSKIVGGKGVASTHDWSYLICNDLDYPCYIQKKLGKQKLAVHLKSSIDYLSEEDPMSSEELDIGDSPLQNEKQLHQKHLEDEEFWVKFFTIMNMVVVGTTAILMICFSCVGLVIQDPYVISPEQYWTQRYPHLKRESPVQPPPSDESIE